MHLLRTEDPGRIGDYTLLFPVGHERRKRKRAREVRELRAALGWYAGSIHDRN